MLRVLQMLSLIICVMIIVLVFPTSVQAQTSPPAVCWPLNETSSGTYDDVVGAHDGVCAGTCPTPTAGRVAGAQAFGNSGVGVDVAAATPFNWGTTDSFSIEVWMQGVAGQSCKGSTQVFVGRDDRNSGLQWWLGCAKNSGVARFQLLDISGQGSTIDGSVVNDGEWHHIVAVRDGSSALNRLYVDGVERGVGTFNYSNHFGSATAALNLGWFNHRSNPGFRFTGALDEVATYNRALTPAEIQQHYTNGLSGVGYCAVGVGAPTITSAPVTAATVGQAYSYDVEATGTPAPTFSLSVAPNGMTIDATSGLITWTPTASGSFNVTVQASNSAGVNDQSFTITVANPATAPVITSAPVTTALVGQPYSYDVEATGQPAPTFSLVAPPGGMNINTTSGLITWTPTAAGSFAVTVQASNSAGATSQQFTITVSDNPNPPPATSACWPLNETSSGTYDDVLGAHDGVCAGNCPTPTGGRIAGAQAFGSSGVGVDVASTTPFDWGATDSFSVELWMQGVAGQSCTSSTQVFVGRDDRNSGLQWWLGCARNSGIARFQLRDEAGQGITIDGSVVNDGEWHHVVAVRDGGSAVNRLYVDGVEQGVGTFSYSSGFASATAALNLGWFNHRTSPGFRFTGSLDEVATYSRALTPAEIQQHYTAGLTGGGYCTTGNVTPTITSSPVTAATVGQAYSYDVEATGVPAPTFSLSVAPSGMTIDAISGLITWTPTAPGSFNVTVQASNSAGATSQEFTITVNDPGQALTFSSTPVATATAGQSYSYDANADGVPAPTYTLLQAPAGMSIDAGTGVIAWLPATNGVYNVTVQASNGGGVGTQSFIVQVKSFGACPAPVRIMPLGDSITRGSGTFPVTGYRQPLYLALTAANYSIDFVGSVENGETAQPAFDPQHEGHSSYQDDAIAANVYQWLTDNPAEVVLLHIGTNDLDLVPPDNTPDDIVAILNEIDRFNPQTIVVLARIINRQTYSPETHQFNLDLATMVEQRIATGDKIVLVDQESALSYPADLADNLHPNSTGYQKMATVWLDALDNFLVICQSTAAPTITSTPVMAATVGEPYTYDVDADQAATYSLVNAPAGMTIDATTGLIAWTPTAVGAYPVVVQATNGAGSATQSYTINVIALVTLYLSTNTDGAIGGVSFADEDILSYNMATGEWALYFDGSDVGLSAVDVTAFTLLADETILLSLDAALDLPGAGRVEVADVVRFVPTTLGSTTAGSFALYFDGSALGLPGIDGLGLSSLGLTAAHLTTGPGTIPGAADKRDGNSGSGTDNAETNALEGPALSHRLFLPMVKR